MIRTVAGALAIYPFILILAPNSTAAQTLNETKTGWYAEARGPLLRVIDNAGRVEMPTPALRVIGDICRVEVATPPLRVTGDVAHVEISSPPLRVIGDIGRVEKSTPALRVIGINEPDAEGEEPDTELEDSNNRTTSDSKGAGLRIDPQGNQIGSWCSQLAGHVIEMNRKALGQQFDLVYGGKSVAALKRLYFKETGFVP
ncbi:MAG: hypothetical protein ABJQ21_17940, partial [Roseibium sp.]